MAKQKVLFLCTGNSCRSQMAEGLLRHHAAHRYEVASAGTHPATLHPMAVEAMSEMGIDISSHRSKSIEDLPGRDFDWVITVCDRARETCPVFPGPAKLLHWSFDDPATASGSHGEKMEVFRRVRGEIEAEIRTFISVGSQETTRR